MKGNRDMDKDILILAIETSCDETAAAVVKNGREVLSNVISSQIELHKLYGKLWNPAAVQFMKLDLGRDHIG